MSDEVVVSPREVKDVAERALVLQSYLLRRSWGVLYLALSASMFVSIFLVPALFGPLGLSSESPLILKLGTSMTASGAAVIAILWTFKRTRDSAEIRNTLNEGRWSRPLGYRVVVPLWVAIYTALILILVFFEPLAAAADLFVHAALAVYLYYALRLSFPLKLPTESIVALAFLVVATIASIALLPFVRDTAPYGILWGSTIVVWLAAARYARTRPVPGAMEGV
jgi:hypothetical protein